MTESIRAPLQTGNSQDRGPLGKRVSAACSWDRREAGGASVPCMRGEQYEMRLEEQGCKLE